MGKRSERVGVGGMPGPDPPVGDPERRGPIGDPKPKEPPVREPPRRRGPGREEDPSEDSPVRLPPDPDRRGDRVSSRGDPIRAWS
jgi:hypothetical protein